MFSTGFSSGAREGRKIGVMFSGTLSWLSDQIMDNDEPNTLGVKIRVFTYKPKSTFKKTKGHRSRLTKLAIESITLKKQKEN